MLAKNLVIELSEFHINVNAIAPGATITERTAQDTGYAKTWSTITPMGRAATTEDIAGAALFLVSKQARHITGQSLVIDGGLTSVSPSPYQDLFFQLLVFKSFVNCCPPDVLSYLRLPVIILYILNHWYVIKKNKCFCLCFLTDLFFIKQFRPKIFRYSKYPSRYDLA